MYLPSITELPLRTTGPIGSDGVSAVTSDWPLLDGELQVGVWACTPGRFSGTTPDENEAMVMVAGRASVAHDDGVFDLAPGTVWTTPRTWSSTWTVHQTVRKMYVIDRRGGTDGVPAFLANAFAADVGEAVPRANATAGSPAEASVSIWKHDRFDVGVWTGTPGSFPFAREGYQEVFVVLDGHATLEVDLPGGGSGSFELVPGAMLLTPSGTTGRWIVHSPVRKAYVTIDD